MTSFQELLNHPLGVVFIDEVDGKERWQVFTGEVISDTDGLSIRFPPNTHASFHLNSEWEERLRAVPASMRDVCTADFIIYVRVSPLPPDANLDDYSPTGINLDEHE